MSQNLIDIDFTAEKLAAIDSALAALEAAFSGLVALTPSQRRSLSKMGDKSEAFCRQAVDVFVQHPDVLPRKFDLDGFRRDMSAIDALRPRLSRMSRLQEKLRDTDTALGSDLMTNALEGYAVLKVAGKGEGLDSLRKMMSVRFDRNSKAPATADSGGQQK